MTQAPKENAKVEIPKVTKEEVLVVEPKMKEAMETPSRMKSPLRPVK